MKCNCINEPHDKIKRIKTVCPACILFKNKVKAKGLRNRRFGVNKEFIIPIKSNLNELKNLDRKSGNRGQRWQLSFISYSKNGTQGVTEKKGSEEIILRNTIYNFNPLKELVKGLNYPAVYNFMSIIQFPPLNSNNKGSKLAMEFGIEIGLTKAPGIKKYIYSVPFDVEDIPISETLIKRIVNTFFDKVCNLYCLFKREGFNLFNYDRNLQLAILLCGLKHMSKSKEIDRLITIISQKINYNFRSPTSIKPTLNNLQALLIINSLLHLPWTTRIRSLYLLQCRRIALEIGLNRECSRMNKRLTFERRQAYIFMNYAFGIIELICDTQMTAPFKLHTKALNLYPISNAKMLSKEEYNQLILSYLTDLFFIYLAEHSSIAFELGLINKHILSKDNLDRYNFILRELKKRYEHKFQAIKSQIDLIKNTNSDEEILNRVDVIANYIQFNHHYIQYLMTVNSLYNWMPSKDDTDKKLKMSKNEAIREVLLQCHLVVHFASKIPPQYLLAINVSSMSLCMFFILRYTDQVSQTSNDLSFQEGIQTLDKIIEYGNINLIASINRKHFDTFSKALNKI